MSGDGNPATAYLGLGSNLGNRGAALRAALDALDEHRSIQLDRSSGVASLYESTAVGGPANQPDYLNSVARVTTTLSPWDLLEVFQGVEQSLGRARGRRWGPRTIDMDLLFYEGTIIHDEALSLPHPRLHERRFVLEPLSEIAPDLVHPLRRQTVAALARRCREREAAAAIVRIAGRTWCEKPDWLPRSITHGSTG